MSLIALYFNIVSLFVAFAQLIIGGIIYSADNKNPVTRYWFIACVFASLWSFSFFLIINASSREISLLVRVFMDASAILLLYFWLRFVLVFLNNKNKFIHYFSLSCVVALLILNSSPWFITDMVPKYIFNYYVNASYGYYLFACYCLVTGFTGLYLLFKNSFTSSTIQNAQTRNIFYGSFLAIVGGSSSFLLAFNIPVPPYFFIMFAALPMIIAYGVVKNKLFNVKVVTTELFTTFIWALLTIRLILSQSQQDLALNLFFLIATVIFGFLIIRSMYNEIHQKEKIEALNEQQLKLIHFMNHQVKGRFGIVKNIFAELMTDDYGTMPPATDFLLRKGLEEANVGVNYVTGILSGASAESGTLHFDMLPMNIRETVQTMFDIYVEQAKKKGLQYEIKIEEGDYAFTGDKLQLGEALRNLIDNAVNFTPQGNVSVTLGFKDSNIAFSVKDSGVGIVDEDKPNLYKAGGRGKDSLKVNVNSTGYGLVFVKNVVEAHGGKVWYESEGKDRGTTFFVTLPKNQAELTNGI